MVGSVCSRPGDCCRPRLSVHGSGRLYHDPSTRRTVHRYFSKGPGTTHTPITPHLQYNQLYVLSSHGDLYHRSRGFLSLTSVSCSTVTYGFDHDTGSDFVRNTTTVLHSLADLSRDIDEVTSVYKSGGGDPPHMFHNITLSYNHVSDTARFSNSLRC